MYKISLICILSTLFLCACHTATTPYTIRVHDEAAYMRAKNMLQYDLTQQKIDTELLPSAQTFSNLNPMNAITARKISYKLFERLSISFRLGIEDYSVAKTMLLQNFVSNPSEVEWHAYGFTFNQGTERITVTILGELDWDNNAILDYIVSFRINQNPLTYKTGEQENHMEMPTRDYTLLVKDINASLYVGNILFIHDYIKQSTGIRSVIYRDYTTAQEGFFQDHVSTSFAQGDEEIVLAPEDLEEKETNKENKNITRLSQ